MYYYYNYFLCQHKGQKAENKDAQLRCQTPGHPLSLGGVYTSHNTVSTESVREASVYDTDEQPRVAEVTTGNKHHNNKHQESFTVTQQINEYINKKET